MYSVRLHAVLASADGVSYPTVSAADLRAAAKIATKAYEKANIEFLFDPDTDISKVVGEDYADDFTLVPVSDISNPNVDPNTSTAARRDELAQRYPGKLVVFFARGYKWNWIENNKRWELGFPSAGWSNAKNSFVKMSTILPPDHGLAHEMGHYFHLAHTFWKTPATLEDVKTEIKSPFVPGDPLSFFDGDRYFDPTTTGSDLIFDTLPDPTASLFRLLELDPCNPAHTTATILIDGVQYNFMPDRENLMSYWWIDCPNFNCRLSGEQVDAVINALENENRHHLIEPRQLYAAVWEPGAHGMTRAIRWSQTDFAKRFDSEIAAGKHCVHMQAYDVGNGVIARDGVWEDGAHGTTRAIGWSQTDFAKRFDSEIAAGKHCVHMQAYDVGNGVIARDGVWEDGAHGTTRAIGWSQTDFAKRFDSEIAAGKHCVHMQAYDVGNGVIARDGVWEDGAHGTTCVIGWSQTDFAKRFDSEIAAGKHCVHMQAYPVAGVIARDGVWEDGARGTTCAIGWSFNDFVERNEVKIAGNMHLVHMQAYDFGDGHLAYDGIWESGSTSQTHIFSETQMPFSDRFNKEISEGHHLVLMQAYIFDKKSGEGSL